MIVFFVLNYKRSKADLEERNRKEEKNTAFLCRNNPVFAIVTATCAEENRHIKFGLCFHKKGLPNHKNHPLRQTGQDGFV